MNLSALLNPNKPSSVGVRTRAAEEKLLPVARSRKLAEAVVDVARMLDVAMGTNPEANLALAREGDAYRCELHGISECVL